MNKIVSTKTTSAIFLAIVLVTGTIAAISPTFIIKGVNAQGDRYYGMDNDYNSYGYSDYRDDKKKYDSYGPTDYGMDKDKKPYGTDSYKSQYSSYEPHYKSKHLSYDKHDKRDKSSKDSSKSVSINKLKCINTNLNINGVNSGNVSIGNKGQGYVGIGAYSSDGSGGYGGDEGYYSNGYNHNKKDKGFDCIINNNNTNTNIVSNVTGGGNVTEITCEECFEENLPAQTFAELNATLTGPGITITIGGETTLVNSLAELCDILEGNSAFDVYTVLNTQFGGFIGSGNAVDIVVCLGQILDFLT